MAEPVEVSENETHSGEVRSKLLARLAVAGVLVAVLLGVLAFFDYLASTTDESEEQVFTKPVPVAPKKQVSQPLTPTESLPPPPLPEKAETPDEPPPPPQVDNHAPSSVEAKPATSIDSRSKRPSPADTPKKGVLAPSVPVPVPEASMAPGQSIPRPATAVEPAPVRSAPHPSESRPAPAVTPPVVSRLFSGFLLQAGVFSSVQRAEELHARLTLSGVASTLETRVQVGPFKTRQEAEAAQAKLKELGVETILVPPRGKN